MVCLVLDLEATVTRGNIECKIVRQSRRTVGRILLILFDLISTDEGLSVRNFWNLIKYFGISMYQYHSAHDVSVNG